VAPGVSRIKRPDLGPLGRPALAVARDRNVRLHAHAAPVMEMLREQIVNSHSMVLLTDATGSVLHSIGDDDSLERAAKVALRPGANWAEATKGTNAIGTALVEEVPTLVHADEHDLHANHFLTCPAAPIPDPRGNILGVLDVTGDRRSHHPHTMALVKMSARMIENHWFSDGYRNVMRLHFHSRVEFIGANGRQFHARARFDWPACTSLADTGELPVATVPAGLASSADTAGSALAQLRTGDAQLDSVLDKIRRVLDSDIPILIVGETGTGKELLARAIHTDSARGKQAFVAVNCASIPGSLIEAELFGCEDGAFTGVLRNGSPGKIVQAKGGTLFLDEIGDMPVALQARLLRVLQERLVMPLGGSKSVAIDVTIICATQPNLREMIEQKPFRENLFYRLNGLAVKLPPLHERSDLQALARRILDRESAGRRLDPAPEVQPLFQHYDWPGNVRQLFNLLRSACVMAADPLITRQHLSDDFLEDALARLPKMMRTLAPVTGAPPVMPAAAGAAVGGGSAIRSPADPERRRDRDHPARRRCGSRQHLRGVEAPWHQPQHHLPQAALEPGRERLTGPAQARPARQRLPNCGQTFHIGIPLCQP